MSVSVSKIMFKDVIGYEKEKEELLEIQKYLSQTEKFLEMGARAPKGVLLFGPNGVGKTLMVKAFANEIGVPLYSVGDSESDDEVRLKLRDVFKKARSNAPSIILIDEIDKYNREPSIGMYPDVNYIDNSAILRELLTLMDGFTPNEGVIVIATSNKKNDLDQSLLRSGRFDRIIQMKIPNREERKALFEHYSKNKKICKTIDFEELALKSYGLSGADIDNVLNEAMLISIRKELSEMTLVEIEESLDRVLLKSATKNSMSKQQKYETAIHETGHAVIILSCKNDVTLNKLSIESRGVTYGFTRAHTDKTKNESINKEKLLRKIRITLGGYAAEELKLGSITEGATFDLQQVLEICSTMVTKYGMYGLDKIIESGYKNSISENKKIRIEQKLEQIIQDEYDKAKRILQDNDSLIEELSEALIQKEVLYQIDIEKIVNKYDIRERGI